MSGFHDAVAELSRLVPEGISIQRWGEVLGRCDELLGGRDPAVRGAVALVPLILPTNPVEDNLITAVDALDGVTSVVGPGQHHQLRLVAVQATRAAFKRADPIGRLLLAGVERDLLDRGSHRPVETGLRSWSFAVAAAGSELSPEAALEISRTQAGLLGKAAGLLEAHEVVDGVGDERLVEAVAASRAAWEHAFQVWGRIAPRRREPLDDLRLAAVKLQLAIRDAPEGEVLEALLRTGFGGSLLSALAVTPAAFRTGSALVATAAMLERRSDVTTTFRLRPPRPPALGARTVDEAKAPDPVVARGSAGPRAVAPAASSSRSAAVTEAEVVLSDRAGLAGLARVRDAGVLARAARDGVGEAQVLVGKVTAVELDRLVDSGEAARAAIGRAGLPMVLHWAKKVFPQFRDEFIQNAALSVMEAAARWDPSRSAWSTFAYGRARFEFLAEVRRLGSERLVPSDRLSELAPRDRESERVIGTRVPSPEEVLVERADRDWVQQLVRGLPAALREAVELRAGLGTGSAATMDEVAARLGISPTTARRHVEQGVELLRGEAAAGAGSPPPGQVSLRDLAVALRRRTGGRQAAAGPGPVPGSRRDRPPPVP